MLGRRTKTQWRRFDASFNARPPKTGFILVGNGDRSAPFLLLRLRLSKMMVAELFTPKRWTYTVLCALTLILAFALL